MASASTIPITHVQDTSLRSNVDPDQAHFPPLPVEAEKEQWEYLDRPDRAQVTFCPRTVPADDPKPKEAKENPKSLRHAQSSPNLREYALVDTDDDDSDESSSAVLVDDSVSDAGSSAVLVSGPPSVWSAGGAGKLSFRDAILQSKNNDEGAAATQATTTHRKKIKKVKPTFVVQQIKRCSKSTGDLRSLAACLEEEIMGDTDAQEYYGRKSAGAQGRRNGLKTRPDEAKRLQMTMAKKAEQRQRQRR